MRSKLDSATWLAGHSVLWKLFGTTQHPFSISDINIKHVWKCQEKNKMDKNVYFFLKFFFNLIHFIFYSLSKKKKILSFLIKKKFGKMKWMMFTSTLSRSNLIHVSFWGAKMTLFSSLPLTWIQLCHDKMDVNVLSKNF